jgi:amino acid adenylation domain-containing protein
VVPLCFRSAPDPHALTAAIEDVVERHEILRTTFPEVDGEPCQHIVDLAAARPLLTNVRTSARALQHDIAAVAQRRFDITREIPIRAYLLLDSAEIQLLVLVIHHIATDGWSISRSLLPELTRAYQARRRGLHPQFAPLPLQYADYTLWHLERLGSVDDPRSEMRRALAFWTTALDGLPAQLALPADRPRPVAGSFRGGVVPLPIDAQTHARLAAFARRSRATIFMVLHAVVATLLTRLGAGTDVAIGSVLSGRTATALNDLVGFFANTIVVRTNTAGNPTFTDLLARVRRFVLDACAHGDVPFDRVVEALNPPRLISRNPLFDVMLGFRTAALNPTRAEGEISLLPRRLTTDHAPFDLTFDFVERPGPRDAPSGIAGTLRYSADLFEPDTAARMGELFLSLLESALQCPDRRIADIHIQAALERPRVVDHSCAPQRDAERSTIERFEAWVTRAPAAEAVVCGDEQWSYHALNTAANRVAWQLIDLGVRAEDIVGIAAPRSGTLVAWSLGVLKAGAACVFLDPDQPAEDIACVVTQIRPRWIVTMSDVQRVLPPGAPLLVMNETGRVDTPIKRPTTNPSGSDGRTPLRADQAAYVAFTAGTRGVSRAVVVTHDALASVVATLANEVPLTASDRVLSVAPVSADRALGDVLWPLVSGATVVMPSPDEAAYVTLLSRLIAHGRVTVLATTPRTARAIASHVAGSAAGLRMVVSRESLTPDTAAMLRRVGTAVIHLYGTTETAIWNTCGALDGETQTWPAIGVPFADARVYVLDSRLEPVPRGIPGDLYVAGRPVARGYRDAPAATAASFVADPHGAPGTRMVRTGDRALWTAEGQLRLLADSASTIRGGIHAATIEAAVCACGGVTDAVVTQATDSTGASRLVAYVTAAVGTRLDSETLHRQLAHGLPAGVTPDVIVQVDHMSLKANGTLDRARLQTCLVPSVEKRVPTTPLEESLCDLFAQVLGVTSVALDDNFFALGGHSLLVMKLINRARTTLGIEIDVRTLFDAATVAGVVERLETAQLWPH